MDEQFVEVECPICNSRDYETVSREGQHKIPLNVSICKGCGFAYLNPRWSKERYSRFYREEYDKFYRPNLGRENSVAAKEIFDRIKIKLKNKKILEIGSGSGYILDHLMKNSDDCKFFAIEPSPDSVEILKEKGIKVIQTDAGIKWKTKEKFDLIIMRHVLEHFNEPNFVLGESKRHLSENGMIYAAVPDLDNPVFPLTKEFFRVVHVSYFNRRSLEILCRKNMLEPIVAGKAPHEIYLMLRKSSRILKDTYDDFEASKSQLSSFLRKEKLYIILYNFRAFIRKLA